MFANFAHSRPTSTSKTRCAPAQRVYTRVSRVATREKRGNESFYFAESTRPIARDFTAADMRMENSRIYVRCPMLAIAMRVVIIKVIE